ncbi:MAG: hypothetical protein LBR86_09750, partial [Tannerella sp.]|nr:hypothetical protein [Tannerella sp.]
MMDCDFLEDRRLQSAKKIILFTESIEIIVQTEDANKNVEPKPRKKTGQALRSRKSRKTKQLLIMLR